MINTDHSKAVSANLLLTYFSLGLASPGTSIRQESQFEACLGNFDHPICNFAARLRLDPWTANRLVEIALERKYFNVYTMPGDSPEERDVRLEILNRAGFTPVYRLEQMACEPGMESGEPLPLELAETRGQRTEAANFMANMFFSRHPSMFRRRVADATTEASDLNLHLYRDRGELLACFMTVEDPTVLGLFNLCVRPGSQDRGIGSLLVSEVKKMAYQKKKIVGLQCDPTLTLWYQRQGFDSCGVVDVFSLQDERRVAIMK